MIGGRAQRRVLRSTSTAGCGRPTRATTWFCSTPTWSPCATGWPRLQYAADARTRASGSSAPSCSTPTTEFSTRHDPQPGRPEWFDHRYRFKPADWGPAEVAGPTLAATGACMYIARERRSTRSGCSTRRTRWAMRTSTTACARGEAGYEVLYTPSARLHHHESITRGTAVGERERKSQRVFWRRWETFFGERARSSNDDGKLRVVYVSRTRIVVGGRPSRVRTPQRPRRARGTRSRSGRSEAQPDWFELRCPVRTFPDYDALVAALTPLQAIKVATWWETATPVWRASVVNGHPVYFVQDIETSYYPDDRGAPSRGLEYLSARVQLLHHLDLESEPVLAELGLECRR